MSVYSKKMPIAGPKSNPKVDQQEKLKASLDSVTREIFRLDGVQVLEFLGSGSYAVVYKVQTAKGKMRACKVINSSKAKVSAAYRLKFMKRELEILQKVSG